MKGLLPAKYPIPNKGPRAGKLLAAGAGMLLLGWVPIFLSAVRVLPSGWWLVAAAFPLTLVGLILGMLSAAEYVAAGRAGRKGLLGLDERGPLE